MEPVAGRLGTEHIPRSIRARVNICTLADSSKKREEKKSITSPDAVRRHAAVIVSPPKIAAHNPTIRRTPIVIKTTASAKTAQSSLFLVLLSKQNP